MIVKKFLFVMRAPPHHGINLQEKLDVILTTVAFEQKLALLFLDDGVFQLKKTQQPEKQGLKDTACIFDALEMYEINDILVEAESLHERGLKQDDLSLSVQLFERKDINAMMKNYDLIIS
jgi:tRNA 2-thiouridine synthesizing protein C